MFLQRIWNMLTLFMQEKDKKRQRSSRDRKSRRDSDDRRGHRDRDQGRDSRHKDRDHKDHKSKSKTEEYKKWGNAGSSVDALAARISQKALEAEKSAEEKELERITQLEADQEVLEEEMRKRRERVKMWQLEKAQRLANEGGETEAAPASESDLGQPVPSGAMQSGGGEGFGVEESSHNLEEEEENEVKGVGRWTLEDEDDDEEEDGEGVSGEGSALTTGDMEEDDIPSELAHVDKSGQNGDGNGAEGDDGKVWFTGNVAVPVVPVDALPSTSIAVAVTAASLAPPEIIAQSPAKKKPTSSRFRSNGAADESDMMQQTASAPSPLSVPVPAPAASAYIDPLDMFMASLYDTGDVTEQENLSSSAMDTAEGSFASRSLAGGSSSVPSSSAASNDQAAINPFGSNFITLDMLLGSSKSSKHRGDGDDDADSVSGSVVNEWESEAAFSPKPVGDDASESGDEEEERARREFMTALRKAHNVEENGESSEAVTSEGAGEDVAGGVQGDPTEGLGRVFAGEGDMIDETEVEAKKKSALELLDEARRGKELRAVDHSTIEYLPFRKNLYIVPRAVARMAPAEVSLKRDVLQVKVRGKDCPAPVDTWEQCGLSERVLAVIKKNGYEAPFAIQKQAIPAIMCGRDIIGVAKTGSGKTLAFLLPMFRHILDQPPLKDSEGPIGLIMAPARELAFQIYNQAKKFTKALGMRVACVYGGAGVADQIADLKRGADIVVCTPGRMIDILCMQAGKLVTLKRVTMVVMVSLWILCIICTVCLILMRAG
jgi:hypothetical protein